MSISFTKMVATGNDFVVVDNRHGRYKWSWASLAKKVCDRKFGIGADGLLLVEKSRAADFKMRIFNPDGSEAQMCGNGSRCVALFAKIHKVADGKGMKIETKAGILSAVVSESQAKINMTTPKDIELNIRLRVKNKSYSLHHINTGVPHAVYFTKGLDKIDVLNIGRAIRFHKAFKPTGVNVDFVQIKSKHDNSLLMRTYERGVEAETLACGTGAVASALISSVRKGLNSPVHVYTRGGALKIYFDRQGIRFSRVFLEGEAKEVFRGEF